MLTNHSLWPSRQEQRHWSLCVRNSAIGHSVSGTAPLVESELAPSMSKTAPSVLKFSLGIFSQDNESQNYYIFCLQFLMNFTVMSKVVIQN